MRRLRDASHERDADNADEHSFDGKGLSRRLTAWSKQHEFP